MSEGFELAPLRSLDDFLLGSARFQLPNYRDAEKWGNRVVNNLLYYQTNYMMMAMTVFGLVGFFNPLKFIGGMIAMSIACGLFFYLTNASRSATQFKKNHPVVGILIIVSGGGVIVYFLGSVLIFLFGILLPLGLIFTHSSLRLRNLKNKLANKIEVVGFKKTPMGKLLESLEYPGISSPCRPLKSFETEKTILGLYEVKPKIKK